MSLHGTINAALLLYLTIVSYDAASQRKTRLGTFINLFITLILCFLTIAQIGVAFK